MSYSKEDIERALKWLRRPNRANPCENHESGSLKAPMITTTKTTRGLVITICNYDRYQNSGNYENHNESLTKATTKTIKPLHYKQEVKKEEEDMIITPFFEPQGDLPRLVKKYTTIPLITPAKKPYGLVQGWISKYGVVLVEKVLDDLQLRGIGEVDGYKRRDGAGYIVAILKNLKDEQDRPKPTNGKTLADEFHRGPRV